MNDNIYKMKRNISPVKGKDISAMIAPGGINVTITKGIIPSVMPKLKRKGQGRTQ